MQHITSRSPRDVGLELARRVYRGKMSELLVRDYVLELSVLQKTCCINQTNLPTQI